MPFCCNRGKLWQLRWRHFVEFLPLNAPRKCLNVENSPARKPLNLRFLTAFPPHIPPLFTVFSNIIHKFCVKIYSFLQKFLVKTIKLHFFLDKNSSCQQFQQGFQQLTVKKGLKLLITTPFVDNLFKTVENLIYITICKSLCIQ